MRVCNCISKHQAPADQWQHRCVQEDSPIAAVEQKIKDRIPYNGTISFRKLMDDMTGMGLSSGHVALAIRAMEAQGVLKRRHEGKLLQRLAGGR